MAVCFSYDHLAINSAQLLQNYEQSASLLEFECRGFSFSQSLPSSFELCLVSAFEKDVDNCIRFEWSSLCIC